MGEGAENVLQLEIKLCNTIWESPCEIKGHLTHLWKN